MFHIKIFVGRCTLECFADANCPYGWMAYNGICHLLSFTSMSMADNLQYCRSQNAELLSLKSLSHVAGLNLLAVTTNSLKYAIST